MTMLELLSEWFGQGFAFPVIAVDVAFCLAGSWCMLMSLPSWQRALLVPAGMLLAAMVFGLAPGFLLPILGVILSGMGALMLLGELVTLAVVKAIQSQRSLQEQ